MKTTFKKYDKWADQNWPPSRRKPYVAIFVLIASVMATHLFLGKFEGSVFVSWFQKWNLFETINVFEYVMLAEHLLLFYALLFGLTAVMHKTTRIMAAVLVSANMLAFGISVAFASGGQPSGYGNYQTIIAVAMVINIVVSWLWEMAKRDAEK